MYERDWVRCINHSLEKCTTDDEIAEGGNENLRFTQQRNEASLQFVDAF